MLISIYCDLFHFHIAKSLALIGYYVSHYYARKLLPLLLLLRGRIISITQSQPNLHHPNLIPNAIKLHVTLTHLAAFTPDRALAAPHYALGTMR